MMIKTFNSYSYAIDKKCSILHKFVVILHVKFLRNMYVVPFSTNPTVAVGVVEGGNRCVHSACGVSIFRVRTNVSANIIAPGCGFVKSRIVFSNKSVKLVVLVGNVDVLCNISVCVVCQIICSNKGFFVFRNVVLLKLRNVLRCAHVVFLHEKTAEELLPP